MSAKRATKGAPAYKWEFKARFRRHAFGWKSQPALTRIKEAVAEIKKVAKVEPVVAAEGAIAFIERVSPALEQVDSSSGSIGTAVNHAIAELVPFIASASVDQETRNAGLERLFEALQADEIPYIERLGDHWGELCATKEVAATWADRLVGITRMALSPDKRLRGHFPGTSACLSALYAAGRFDELIELLRVDTIWPYKRWAVRALVAKGDKVEALRYAESCRGPWAGDRQVDSMCEEILLSSGLLDEAYSRYGVRANQGSTYLATFRAVSKKYPQKSAGEILADLVKTTPGEEGKWFAAAKEAGLYDEALALASRTPCDPKTLSRAARDYAQKQPAFAVAAGLLALHWLLQGYGYEITSLDVWDAYRGTLLAADHHGNTAEVKKRVRTMVAAEGARDRFVTKVLGSELGL
jgi:hypothetical protein